MARLTYNGVIEVQHAGGGFHEVSRCAHQHRNPETAERCADRTLKRERRETQAEVDAGLLARSNARAVAGEAL
jgi:hypothetical protein